MKTTLKTLLLIACGTLVITWCSWTADKVKDAWNAVVDTVVDEAWNAKDAVVDGAWDAKDAVVDGAGDVADTVKEKVGEVAVEAKPENLIEGEVQVGDTIGVNYVWALQEDKSVFDTSLEDVAKANDIHNPQRPYEPLTFTVWAKQMIPGFDKGVVWMKTGETKEIKIPAAEWYGERTDEAIQEIPMQVFTDAGTDPVIWEQYNFGIAPGTVLEIWEETVKLDFNHFLAGKDLMFEVTIEEITKPTAE